MFVTKTLLKNLNSFESKVNTPLDVPSYIHLETSHLVQGTTQRKKKSAVQTGVLMN